MLTKQILLQSIESIKFELVKINQGLNQRQSDINLIIKERTKREGKL